MTKLIFAYRITLAGILIGSIAGYFYWEFYGCTNGCSITSSPWKSTLYGALMGGLVLNGFEPKSKKSESEPKG